MAGKMNVMKLLQEVRGLAAFASRRVTNPPLPSGIWMPVSPWRMQAMRLAQMSAKRTIRIAEATPLEIPDPVKIRHLPSRGASTKSL